MHPTIGQVGIFEITSYSLMLGLSFAAGLLIAAARAKRAGIDPALAIRFAFWAFIGALAGARLFYVLVNPDVFSGNLLAAVNPMHNGAFKLSGLVMNGGIIGTLAAMWAFTKRRHLPLLKTLDTIAPGLAVGIFLTRLGCFLNGCCYGRPTDLPWGVVFPASSPAGRLRQPIHPTQLYEAAYGLLILGIVLSLEKKFKQVEGFATCLVLMLYGAARFGVEFLRYHEGAGLLSHNHNVSVMFIAAGATGMVLNFGKREDCLLWRYL
jgi:phosphatidylglycerol:prolipoprotein diacylglycerol transferase